MDFSSSAGLNNSFHQTNHQANYYSRDISLDPPNVRYDSGQSLQCFSFSSHQNQIAIGGRDIRLLTVNSAITTISPLRSGSFTSSSTSNHTTVNDLSYHPHHSESHLLLCASTTGSILLYDVSSGGLKRSSAVFDGHTRSVNRVRWSLTDFSLFVSCSQDGTVKLWDIRENPRHSINEINDSASVRDIAFNPINGNILAAAYENGAIALVDIRIMKTLGSINAHQKLVLSLDWHPQSSELLASGSMDRTIKVWDTQTLNSSHSNISPLYSINCPNSVGIVRWRPNHFHQLASCASMMDSEITIYNLPTPFIPLGIMANHRDIVTGLIFTPHGEAALTCSKDGTVQRNFLSSASELLNNLSFSAVSFNNSNDLAAINEKIERVSLINAKNPPNIFPQHFQFHQNNKNIKKGLVNVTDTFKAMRKSSTANSSTRPLTRHSESESFLYFARHYRLFDDSIINLCEHNQKIARDMEKHNIENLWNIVKLLFGQEQKEEQTRTLDEQRMANKTPRNKNFQVEYSTNKSATPADSSLLAILPEVHLSHCYQRSSAPFAPNLNNLRRSGLLESSSYRQSILYASLVQLVNINGDVQTACSIALMLQNIVNFPVSSTRSWLHSYIELLHTRQLHSEAALIASHSEDEWIARHTAHSTTFTLLCAHCKHTSRTIGSLCSECHELLASCAICQLPVSGIFVWCQGCAHGGHIEHWNEWFKNFNVCPTGCLHQCIPTH